MEPDDGHSSTGERAFFWDPTENNLRDLGDLPGGIDRSVALDINERSEVVGFSIAETGSRAFLWTPTLDELIDLGDLPGGAGAVSNARAINDHSQVTGRSGGNAFLWDPNQGMVALEGLPRGGRPFDVNIHGHVVAGGSTASLWMPPHGWRDLNDLIDPNDPLAGAVVLTGNQIAINDNGVIASTGEFPDGTQHAFLVLPSVDTDGDGLADALDNCPETQNPDQLDTDMNGVGDACNADEDGDGDEYADGLDNCPNASNPDQADLDGDFIGDVCDPFPDDPDNAQAQCEADLGQALQDLDQCLSTPPFLDEDEDGIPDQVDRCAGTPMNLEVDDSGCSQEQYCQGISRLRRCFRSDWRNDEPVRVFPGDCRFDWPSRSCVAR